MLATARALTRAGPKEAFEPSRCFFFRGQIQNDSAEQRRLCDTHLYIFPTHVIKSGPGHSRSGQVRHDMLVDICCSDGGQTTLDCVPQAAVCLPGAGTGIPVLLIAGAVSVSHQLSEVIVTMTYPRAVRAADLNLSE